MNGGTRSLSTPQRRAILALLQASSIAQAAADAGVGVRTLERWLAEDDEFVKEFRSTRTRVVETAIARLQDAVTDAVECLKRNLDPPAPPGVQVRAASVILEHAMGAIKDFDLIERIEALERSLQER